VDEVIVAVDPGGTTGFSGASDEGELMFADQLPPFEFEDWLYSWAQSQRDALHLVMERFTITQRTLKVSRGGSYDALEVIGHARWCSLRFCGRDLVMQQPADVMRLVSDDRLRAMGWYQRGKGHANDSLRHLAARCAKLGLVKLPSLT
jgi:hypothetical protein